MSLIMDLKMLVICSLVTCKPGSETSVAPKSNALSLEQPLAMASTPSSPSAPHPRALRYRSL